MIKAEKCVLSDADEIRALECECMSRPWSFENIVSALESENTAMFKVTSDGKLAGFGGVDIVEGAEASVTDVVVRSDCRRKGVASAILAAIISESRAKKVETVLLEVWEGNLPARALYEKFGFSLSYRRKNYYAEGDALVMTLKP